MADYFACLPLELILTIFGFLHKDGVMHSLVPYLTVNMHWFVIIASLLYKEVKLNAIWHIRDSPNAEKYLLHTHSLTFGLDDERFHSDIIRKWAKPPLCNLDKISFMPGAVLKGLDADYIIPYLQPSVSSIQLFGVRWTSGLLSALRTRCPGLKELSIKHPYKTQDFSLDAQSFDTWLQGFPSFHSISIFYTGKAATEPVAHDALTNLLSPSTVRNLLKRPLRCLRLEYRLENWCYLFSGPTSNTLRELSIRVKPYDISLLPYLAGLRKLHIQIDGECQVDVDVLSPICSMTGLQSLRVIFAEMYELERSQILSLVRLTNLEVLEIFSRGQEPADTDEEDDEELTQNARIGISGPFDNRDFDLLASSLPKLRHVCLLFDWRQLNSNHVLKSAAFLWPQLEYLCLGYDIDLTESIMMSQNRRPLFPHLKHFLKVRALIGDLATNYEVLRDDFASRALYVSNMARILQIAFPRLEGIRIREFYLQDDCPNHHPIDVRGLMDITLVDPGWHWSRYSMEEVWDFDHMI